MSEQLPLEMKCCAGCTCTDPHSSKPAEASEPSTNVQES